MGKRKGALEMNGFDEFKQTNFYPPLKSLEKLWSLLINSERIEVH